MRRIRELTRQELRTSLTSLGITIGRRPPVVSSPLADRTDGLVGMGSRYVGDATDRIIRMPARRVIADERVREMGAAA